MNVSDGENIELPQERPERIPPRPPAARLTREECITVLNMYSNWNVDQKATTEHGQRVLNARRDLLIKVYERLKELV